MKQIKKVYLPEELHALKEQSSDSYSQYDHEMLNDSYRDHYKHLVKDCFGAAKR